MSIKKVVPFMLLLSIFFTGLISTSCNQNESSEIVVSPDQDETIDIDSLGESEKKLIVSDESVIKMSEMIDRISVLIQSNISEEQLKELYYDNNLEQLDSFFDSETMEELKQISKEAKDLSSIVGAKFPSLLNMDVSLDTKISEEDFYQVYEINNKASTSKSICINASVELCRVTADYLYAACLVIGTTNGSCYIDWVSRRIKCTIKYC